MRLSLKTPLLRTSVWARSMAVAALAAGVWALSVAASAAQAHEVSWSVTLHQPGVVLGMSHAQPVLVPVPVYVYRGPARSSWDDRRPWHHHRHHGRHGWDDHRHDRGADDRNDRFDRNDRGGRDGDDRHAHRR